MNESLSFVVNYYARVLEWERGLDFYQSSCMNELKSAKRSL